MVEYILEKKKVIKTQNNNLYDTYMIDNINNGNIYYIDIIINNNMNNHIKEK